MVELQHNRPALWETLHREPRAHYGIFTLWTVRRRHPTRGQAAEFVVLEAPTWVNIVPVTAEGHVVLVEQYRHGIDTLTLEIPGGMVAPGEDTRSAAERECREETGYASEEPAELLGVNYPNPAFLTNTCYSYLWRNCRRVAEPRWDRHEELALRLVPVEELPELVRRGEIRHSLVLLALLWFLCPELVPASHG